jgi:hypothetical protein
MNAVGTWTDTQACRRGVRAWRPGGLGRVSDEVPASNALSLSLPLPCESSYPLWQQHQPPLSHTTKSTNKPNQPPPHPRPHRTKQRPNAKMDDHAKAEAMKRAKSIVASLGIKLSRPAQPAAAPIPPPPSTSTTAISAPPSSAAPPTAAASVLNNTYYEEEEEEEEEGGNNATSSYRISDAAAMQDVIISSPAAMGTHKGPESVLDKMHKAQEKFKEKHAAVTGRSFIDQVREEGGRECGSAGEGGK